MTLPCLDIRQVNKMAFNLLALSSDLLSQVACRIQFPPQINEVSECQKWKGGRPKIK